MVADLLNFDASSHNGILQANEAGKPPLNISKFYAKGALQYLIPILTEILARQVT